ncbi:MAG: hypothetical protein FRX49_02255 [Trebouxia sp. A1-2]|nr:MAG: hypothetical protein FRX49_02255 [Trebouxia sp. A1-2]
MANTVQVRRILGQVSFGQKGLWHVEVDMRVTGFGACGNTWNIEEALNVDVAVHNLAKVAEAAQAAKLESGSESAWLEVRVGYYGLKYPVHPAGRLNQACIAAASICCTSAVLCLAMHLEVHVHGVKAGTIQGGPVHELCQTLPALTGQQLQPRWAYQEIER